MENAYFIKKSLFVLNFSYFRPSLFFSLAIIALEVVEDKF